MKNKILQKIAAVLIALIIWQLAAMSVGMSFLLASPLDVAARLSAICTEDGFLATVFFSLLRVMAGFFSALACGILLAIAAGKFPVLETLLWPYVVTMKSVPVASFIILCLMWLSFSQLTVFIAFLIVFPVIYSNVLQGIKSTDPQMIEMANLYKVPWSRRFLYIYVPAIKPYLISSCTVGIGMAWKAGVAAEVIGVIKGSIGEMLYESKIYFMTADLFAWTLIIILLSVILEKVLIKVIKFIFAEVEKL